MKKGQNSNHPKKGSRIKVDPIKSKKHIRTINKILADKPLEYALFVIGINTNLRAIDILGIRVGQVKNLKPGTEFALKERKTGKERLITLNRPCYRAIEQLLESRPHGGGHGLFIYGPARALGRSDRKQ